MERPASVVSPRATIIAGRSRANGRHHCDIPAGPSFRTARDARQVVGVPGGDPFLDEAFGEVAADHAPKVSWERSCAPGCRSRR